MTPAAPPAPPVVAPPAGDVIDAEPPPAPINEAAAFKAYYAEGAEHFTAKRFKEASAAFAAAYALKPEPRLLFNIAQCYRKQELLEDAIAQFDRYLEADPGISSAVRGEVDAYRAELRAKLEARVVTRRAPKVIVVSTEKPVPRALLPLGAVGLAVGLSAAAVGGAFLGIHGTCAGSAEPPALECDRLYNSLAPGIALLSAGGSLVVIGTVFLSLSLRNRRTEQPARQALLRGLSAPLVTPSSLPFAWQ